MPKTSKSIGARNILASPIISMLTRGLFALDPKPGKENWSAPVLSMRSVSCSLYVAGLVFGTTGSGGGGHYLVTVKPGKEPEEAYRVKKYAPYVSTPVCKGN